MAMPQRRQRPCAVAVVAAAERAVAGCCLHGRGAAAAGAIACHKRRRRPCMAAARAGMRLLWTAVALALRSTGLPDESCEPSRTLSSYRRSRTGNVRLITDARRISQ